MEDKGLYLVLDKSVFPLLAPLPQNNPPLATLPLFFHSLLLALSSVTAFLRLGRAIEHKLSRKRIVSGLRIQRRVLKKDEETDLGFFNSISL